MIGSGLMLLGAVLRIPGQAIMSYIVQNGSSVIRAARLISYASAFIGLINLAGIVLLFYAVWKNFGNYPLTTSK